MKNQVNTVKPSPIPSEGSLPPKAPLASSSSEEGSSLMSNDLAVEDSCQLKRTPSSLMQEKLDHRSQSTLKSRIRDSPYRMSLKRSHLFKIFKWSLIAFNGLLIFVVLIGVFIYFSEFREKTNFKLTEVEEENFSNDFTDFGSNHGTMSSGPKYAWIVSMFTFALLLAIPCLGFIGAIKEHTCLLILYGVIFFVNAFVVLIFRSPWFIIPAFIASAALGLVFLIRNTSETTYDSTDEINSKDGSKYRIKWNVNSVV